MTPRLQKIYRQAAREDRINGLRRPSQTLQQKLFTEYTTRVRKSGGLAPADLTPRG